MTNIDFIDVLACDDVRREETGKEILIGVYPSDIRVSGFPSRLRLVFWAHVRSKNAGKFAFEFRVLSSEGVQLGLGTGEAEVRRAQTLGSIPFGPVAAEIQSEGYLRLEFRESDQDWAEIFRIPVRKQEEQPHSS